MRARGMTATQSTTLGSFDADRAVNGNYNDFTHTSSDVADPSLMIDLGLVTKRPRIVCAQAEAANPLYLSYLTGFEVFEPIAARPTIANAIQIGNPVSIEKAISVHSQPSTGPASARTPPKR